jgi:hypothetical protein
MDNETAQLYAFIADVVQHCFRYLNDRDRADPHAFGQIVAREVIQRLEAADIVVVSRWSRN